MVPVVGVDVLAAFTCDPLLASFGRPTESVVCDSAAAMSSHFNESLILDGTLAMYHTSDSVVRPTRW